MKKNIQKIHIKGENTYLGTGNNNLLGDSITVDIFLKPYIPSRTSCCSDVFRCENYKFDVPYFLI